ncbi:MAG: RnfABCDGE type electron transport complex subunit D [Bacteroidales bacterium]|nr:RnfABCDGE type electron transport complex subunit D [Bacteroidales bacterium]
MMDKMLVSPSPHIHAAVSTRTLMRDVIIALVPAIVVSVLFYGLSELLVLAVSVASCVLLEWAVTKWLLRKPSTVSDLSAVVTGLLLAMNLPCTTPWWVVFIGAVISICVAKLTFGGIGQNVFNPAITGRVFLLISFPAYMTDWTVPQGFITKVDAFSGSTLLGIVNEQGAGAVEGLDYLQTLFLNIGGSAGEISALALLAGFVYLVIRKVVKPWITLSIFATVAVISAVFCAADPSIYTGPLFNLLTGGLILGACFMATDYVTSPMTDLGGIIYGIGIGFIVMMIRYFGAYPEGVSFAILIMNMIVPLINRAFHQKKYGRA